MMRYKLSNNRGYASILKQLLLIQEGKSMPIKIWPQEFEKEIIISIERLLNNKYLD